MKTRTLSHDEISTLCLELALFLHAGAESGSGLVLLAEETQETELRNILLQMARQVDGGAPLSQAIEDSGAFPRNVWAMLRVGEKTGRSEEALQSLAQYHDRRSQMDRHLRSALLYPSILLLIMLAVIVVLLAKVLPIFNDVYASLGGQLTGVAGGLLRLGQLLDTILPGLCVILALAVILLAVFSVSERFRARLLSLWRSGRGDIGLTRSMLSARFAQALSMALNSGMTAEEGLVSASILMEGQPAATRRIQVCVDKLSAGESLPRALRAAELLPAAECRLLELGFASGSGENAIREVARRLERDAEDALERRISQVEPAMVVITALLVGAILLSVMLPLTHIMAAIG